MLANYASTICNCLRDVASESELLLEAVKQAISEGKQIFIIGNGGSLASASHIVNDLKKSYSKIYALDSLPMLTALANDFGYDMIFGKQLEGLVGKGDLLIALTVSGKSRNIVQAIVYAGTLGANIAVLTGSDSGFLANEFCIRIPSKSYGIVECCHLEILHWIADKINKCQS